MKRKVVFSTASTLLAFLTTQELCPTPVLALRSSVEGVQSGLEEELNPSSPAAGMEEGRGSYYDPVEVAGRVVEALVAQGRSGKAELSLTEASGLLGGAPAHATLSQNPGLVGWINRALRGAVQGTGLASVRIKKGEPGRPAKETSDVPPSAGMEESGIDAILAVLEEAAQGPGMVLFGPEALRGRVGLEELAARAPRELARRMIFAGLEEVAARRLQQRNPWVHLVGGGLSDLLPVLLSMPEADRVTVVGDHALASGLEELLPASMSVALLPPGARLDLLLAGLGVPLRVSDQINASGLGEQLARSRAA